MQKVLITGGTGLVGTALSQYLTDKGFQVTIMSRSSHKQDKKGLSYAAWDVKKQMIDKTAVLGSDYIIHLAGAGIIDKKWTDEYKKEIITSRTESTRLLTETLKENIHHVKAFISGSAIGWYGSDTIPPHLFTEDEPASDDFLGQVCYKWEQSTSEAENTGVRVCRLRSGIVLSKQGGALAEFKKPLRFGVAAIPGNGMQMISWIHIDDLCRMYYHAMISGIKGSYNAVSPAPVSNKKLILTLAAAMKGKFFTPLHIPEFLIRLILGSRSIEVLKSTTVSMEKIRKTGFTFQYPSIESAIKSLV